MDKAINPETEEVIELTEEDFIECLGPLNVTKEDIKKVDYFLGLIDKKAVTK